MYGLAQFIGTIGSAIVLLYGGLRWLLRQLDRRNEAERAAHDEMLERKLDAKLDPIRAELHTNSGSSLKDHIVRLSEQVSSLQATDDRRHRENVKELEAQQGQIDELRDSQRILRRAVAALLRKGEHRGAMQDEVLVELDRFDETSGKYRSTGQRRRQRPDDA